MSDDTIKINGFSHLAYKLQANNINATQDELASLFDEYKTDQISVEDYAKKVADKYGLASNDIIDVVSEMASNIGDGNILSLSDIKIQKDKDFDKILENSPELQQTLINMLDNIVVQYEHSFRQTKNNSGVIAKGWDWIKNTLKVGASSDKTQEVIDESKSLIENLKKNPSRLKEIYEKITGNKLNSDEFDALCQNKVDFSKSDIVNSIIKYAKGQKSIVNIVSSVTSALAVTGLVASGIFTGGLSVLAAGAICVGAGTAAYMVPQAVDGLTEQDGYSGSELAQDVAIGVADSLITTATIGAAKGIGGAITSKVGNETFGKFLASEATAAILGDGIAISNYLADAAVTNLDDLALGEEDKKAYEMIINGEISPDDDNYDEILKKAQRYNEISGNNTDFSLEGLGKVALTSTAASLAAGGLAFGVQSTVGNVAAELTQNLSPAAQINARLLTGAATGLAAGAGAGFVAGGTGYLLSKDGEEINFKDWLNASTENAGTGAIIGCVSGVAFEALHIAAGTPAPLGTKKTITYKSENGTGVEYLDENGKVIARDISAKDLHNYLQSKEALVEYNPQNQNIQSINESIRTVRFCFDGQIQQFNWWDAIQPAQIENNVSLNEATECHPEINNQDIVTLQGENGLSLAKYGDGLESIAVIDNSILAGVLSQVPILHMAHESDSTTHEGVSTEIASADNRAEYIQNKEMNVENDAQNKTVENQTSYPKVNVKADSKLDAKIKSLADEAAAYLSSNNRTQGTMDEVLGALGFSHDEIAQNGSGYKTTSEVDGKTYAITARSKGADSIYSKIVKKLADGDIPIPESSQEALRAIGDAQGLRIIMGDLAKNIPNAALSKTEIEALQTAQNRTFVDNLIEAIKADRLHVSEVENYCGKDGIGYLTETDIKYIGDAYKDWFNEKLARVQSGKDTDFEIKYDEKNRAQLVDKKSGKEYGDTMAVCRTKNRDNGYTGTNISIVDSQGQNVELQLRGSKVNEIAELEHIIYDIRKGKTTVSGSEYDGIREIISKIYKNEDSELAQAYDKYYSDVYRAAREIELGIRQEGDMPRIEDYEILAKNLSENELKMSSIEAVGRFKALLKNDLITKLMHDDKINGNELALLSAMDSGVCNEILEILSTYVSDAIEIVESGLDDQSIESAIAIYNKYEGYIEMSYIVEMFKMDIDVKDMLLILDAIDNEEGCEIDNEFSDLIKGDGISYDYDFLKDGYKDVFVKKLSENKEDIIFIAKLLNEKSNGKYGFGQLCHIAALYKEDAILSAKLMDDESISGEWDFDNIFAMTICFKKLMCDSGKSLSVYQEMEAFEFMKILLSSEDSCEVIEAMEELKNVEIDKINIREFIENSGIPLGENDIERLTKLVLDFKDFDLGLDEHGIAELRELIQSSHEPLEAMNRLKNMKSNGCDIGKFLDNAKLKLDDNYALKAQKLILSCVDAESAIKSFELLLNNNNEISIKNSIDTLIKLQEKGIDIGRFLSGETIKHISINSNNSMVKFIYAKGSIEISYSDSSLQEPNSIKYNIGNDESQEEFYGDDGRIEKIKFYGEKGKKLNRTEVYTYDNQNRVSMIEHSDGNNKPYRIESYSYDNQNRVKRIQYYNIDDEGNPTILAGDVIYKYNDNGSCRRITRSPFMPDLNKPDTNKPDRLVVEEFEKGKNYPTTRTTKYIKHNTGFIVNEDSLLETITEKINPDSGDIESSSMKINREQAAEILGHNDPSEKETSVVVLKKIIDDEGNVTYKIYGSHNEDAYNLGATVRIEEDGKEPVYGVIKTLTNQNDDTINTEGFVIEIRQDEQLVSIEYKVRTSENGSIEFVDTFDSIKTVVSNKVLESFEYYLFDGREIEGYSKKTNSDSCKFYCATQQGGKIYYWMRIAGTKGFYPITEETFKQALGDEIFANLKINEIATPEELYSE